MCCPLPSGNRSPSWSKLLIGAYGTPVGHGRLCTSSPSERREIRSPALRAGGGCHAQRRDCSNERSSSPAPRSARRSRLPYSAAHVMNPLGGARKMATVQPWIESVAASAAAAIAAGAYRFRAVSVLYRRITHAQRTPRPPSASVAQMSTSRAMRLIGRASPGAFHGERPRLVADQLLDCVQHLHAKAPIPLAEPDLLSLGHHELPDVAFPHTYTHAPTLPFAIHLQYRPRIARSRAFDLRANSTSITAGRRPGTIPTRSGG